MTLLHRLSDSAGQSLIEFALVLPLCLVISFGVAEVGNALLDSHTVTRLTREGSNLISRNTSIDDAVIAMQSMSNGQVDFSTDSKLIFSVIKRGPTIGSVNYDTQVLYQRYEFGALAASSRISTAGGGSFGPRTQLRRCEFGFRHEPADHESSAQLGDGAGRIDLRDGDL